MKDSPFAMTPLSLAIIGIASVVFAEWLMWNLFRKKIEGIHFPHTADTSQWKFFSVRRIRMCAYIHTAFLIASIIIYSILIT